MKSMIHNGNGRDPRSALAHATERSRPSDVGRDFEAFEGTYDNAPDLVCLSHLRWNFVYQRPQHLMSRCARRRRVFFFEEPVLDTKYFAPWLELTMTPGGVCVAVPHVPPEVPSTELSNVQRKMIDELSDRCGIKDCVLWYYTPMSIPFTRHLKPIAVVYDCMDELSAFRGAPPEMRANERELMSRADLVFTGGLSLYEAKRSQHPNIHPFPSSVDVEHFAKARLGPAEPQDQAAIPHPRLGFAGVIDERMDVDLIRGVAERRPEWHIVLLGPAVKIDPADLPCLPNIHYLGPKPYEELPNYIAGWEVAIVPFARNESTRYISPTKTPEYLAAGTKVVSTSIRDVVRTYSYSGLIRIADDPDEFVSAVQACLDSSLHESDWLSRVDRVLAENSWDKSWEKMTSLLDSVTPAHHKNRKRSLLEPVFAYEETRHVGLYRANDGAPPPADGSFPPAVVPGELGGVALEEPVSAGISGMGEREEV